MTKYPATSRLAAALMAAFLAIPAFAQTSTWDGGGTPTTTWSTATNWTGDVAPVAGNALVFAGTANRTTSNDYAANTAFSGISLNTAGWTLAGSAINFSGIIAQNNVSASSSDNLISLAVNLVGNAEFAAVASSTRLTFTGGIIGTGSVTKTGAGTSRWNSAANANTFSGGLIINAGTVDLLGADNLPNGTGKGDVTIASGATLLVNNSNQTMNGLNGAGTLNKTGSNTRTVNVGANNANGNFTGTVTLSGGSSSITKIGTGTQIFGGSYTGPAFNVNAGKALINGSITGTTTIGAAGALGGTGTINSAATINGALRTNTAPVNATSRLTFSSTFTLGATSTTTFDIDGANFTGVTVSTTDALTFGGNLDFNFVNGVTPGDYDLFSFTDANTGSFSNVTVTSIGALSLDNNVWSGTFGGNTYSFSQLTGNLIVSAVPEPSAFAAIAGVLGLGFAASRRRRAA